LIHSISRFLDSFQKLSFLTSLPFLEFCMFSMVWNMCIVSADAPTPWKMLFQDPATSNMEGIVDLHHDIMFFLIVILVLVLWLGARIVSSFHHALQPVPERFNHHTSLELVWAILPSVIVTLIALPS
jgi:cytochrome c oxidase subunit 2